MESLCNVDVSYDYPEFYSASIHKARKPRECCECGEQIKSGDRYEYVAGKWDGHFEVFCTCMACMNVRNGQMSNWCHGQLREDLWECLGIDYIDGRVAEWAKKEDEPNIPTTA